MTKIFEEIDTTNYNTYKSERISEALDSETNYEKNVNKPSIYTNIITEFIKCKMHNYDFFNKK